LFYYKKALLHFYQLSSYQNIVYTYQSLGWMIYETDVNTAWRYLQQADSIDKKYDIKSTQLPLVISFVLFKKGNIKEAIQRAKESYQLGFNTKQLFVSFQSAQAIAGYYKSLKEIDSAMRYTELYAYIKDSIRSDKQYKDAGRMQAKLEYDKEIFQKELLQKEEIKRERLIRNYILVAACLLIIILILIYRAYQSNIKTARLLAKQNDEKAILLKEIHHRVKNNLTIVSSILDMQQRSNGDPKFQNIFIDAKTRIGSMALVHKTLYEQNDFGNIDVQTYFEGLFESIYQTYKKPNKEVIVQIKTNGITLNLDILIPLALVINEMLTNSFKYAFEQPENGWIQIELKAENYNYIFTYSDNGPGLSDEADILSSKTLGSSLIRGLTAQIDGNLKVLSSHSGLTYHIVFKEINKE
jgi:two-component sensor histidine kinase